MNEWLVAYVYLWFCHTLIWNDWSSDYREQRVQFWSYHSGVVDVKEIS